MRLVEFIENENDITDFIIKNCKQYLDKNKELLPLYHGEYELPKVALRSVISNRSPLSSSKFLHDFLNQIISDAGCEANRSNSVFCSGSIQQAKTYGYVYVSFPVGAFSYTWSDKIEDAYVSIGSAVYQHQFFQLIDPKELTNFDEIQTQQRFYFGNSDSNYSLDQNRVKELVNTYHCSDLVEAIKSQNEIMIKCDKIFLVKFDLYQSLNIKDKLQEKLNNTI